MKGEKGKRKGKGKKKGKRKGKREKGKKLREKGERKGKTYKYEKREFVLFLLFLAHTENNAKYFFGKITLFPLTSNIMFYPVKS